MRDMMLMILVSIMRILDRYLLIRQALYGGVERYRVAQYSRQVTPF